MVVIEAEIPDGLTVLEQDEASLPPRWKSSVATKKTKDIGTNWAKNLTTAVLSVPSALVPNERNYLLNPAHPDFSQIRFTVPQPFAFDKRLK